MVILHKDVVISYIPPLYMKQHKQLLNSEGGFTRVSVGQIFRSFQTYGEEAHGIFKSAWHLTASSLESVEIRHLFYLGTVENPARCLSTSLGTKMLLNNLAFWKIPP